MEIHGFSDASEKAYAVVVYLRSAYNDGMVSTCVMASKTRVAPIKGQTIPRLELLEATILSRLVNTILKSLPIRPQVYCWTDSMTVVLDQKPPPLEAVRTDSSSRDTPVYGRELEILPRIEESSRHTIQIMYN